MAELTRDGARQIWAESGSLYADLTPVNLQSLRGMINRAMRESGVMQGSYRAAQRFTVRLSEPRPWADLRCRSYYFDGRQAITFDKDGYIGFAGWADQWNVQPILKAFVKWVEHLSKMKALNSLEDEL